MSAKNTTPEKKIPNNWKLHHESLNDADKTAARENIMQSCGWSQATFYVKMKAPEALLFWQKKLVAAGYKKRIDTIFPEEKKVTETIAA